MRYRGAIVAGAAITALALPASAAAHSDVSAGSVAKHIRSADQALDMVDTLVTRSQDAKAAVQAARNQRQTSLGAREARALVRSANTTREEKRAANATRRVAAQLNANVETYAAVVDEVAPRFQAGIAEAVESGLTGRELALDILSRLAGELPPQAQQGIARAITALSSDGEDESIEIIEALGSGSLSPSAEKMLAATLETATAAIDEGIARIRGLLDIVPVEARPHVAAAVERVVAQLELVKQRLSGLIGSLPVKLPVSIPLP